MFDIALSSEFGNIVPNHRLEAILGAGGSGPPKKFGRRKLSPDLMKDA